MAPKNGKRIDNFFFWETEMPLIIVTMLPSIMHARFIIFFEV
jgi:uncharacterized integral membrane protein